MSLAALGLALLAILPPPVQAADVVIDVDPPQSKVNFTLGAFLHTVHGTFAMKSGTLHFDPSSGKAGGEMIVDLTSGTTGLAARDNVMHSSVLETRQYPEARFVPDTVTGRFNPDGESTLDIHGVLSIHGGTHDWTFHTLITTKGTQLAAITRSSIPYVQWGMKNPSTFVLHVGDHVDVEVRAGAHLRSTAP